MPDRPHISEAIEEAKRTARLLSPVCDVCGVAYVDEYRGACQEPLPPYTDASRTCPGTVALMPEHIAQRSVEAAAPALRNQLLDELARDPETSQVVNAARNQGAEEAQYRVEELEESLDVTRQALTEAQVERDQALAQGAEEQRQRLHSQLRKLALRYGEPTRYELLEAARRLTDTDHQEGDDA